MHYALPWLSQPTESEVQAFLRSVTGSPLSYAAVGATQATPPAGYVHDHNRVRLGEGEEVWQRAKAAIRQWKMFDFTWVCLCWPDTPLETGREVAILVRALGVWWLNASRIVYTLDEESRFGFAYGTLADHAETGEERFTVERDERDGSVWYDLLAFSRPHSLPARLGYPLVRRQQKLFARASLQAMQRAVRGN